LASIWSVGSRWLSPKQPLRFGNKLIFVNYIYMNKKNFNNCIQIA
jgi:hypothetical protein